MKNVEKVLVIIFLIGIIFKAFSIVGGNILVFLSLFSLSIFYFFFTFPLLNNLNFNQVFKKKSYDTITSLRTLYSIFCSFAFYSFIIGMLFRIFNWENAVLIFWFGVVFLAICFTISLVKYFQNHSIFYKSVLMRIALFIIFYILYFLIDLYVGWAPR